MTPRDPDRLIRAFLSEGSEQLADPVYDAVRAEIDTKPQRVVIGPWRMPTVNKIVPVGLAAAAAVVVLVVGAQVLRPADLEPASSAAAATPPPASSPAASPGSTPTPTQAVAPPDGTVRFQGDDGPATTAVDLVVDGATVSGTAVTTFAPGKVHTVGIECAARDGNTWALGGTTRETSFPGERAGDWSAVVVRDGSPQAIGIWLSDPKIADADCSAWLGGLDLATIDAANFKPVEAGMLVPPPVAGGPDGAPGGTVRFQGDDGPATTAVDLVVDGATVSGTAVTTFAPGKVHTVGIECAGRDGDTWALGGTTRETSFPGERAGTWSAVVVRDGSPQAIGIWLSDPKADGADCDAWLGGLDLATIDAAIFQPVEAGMLVPPPVAAP